MNPEWISNFDAPGEIIMKDLVVTGGIVTYNNADIIEKCIESILKYTKNCQFKLYIYDNCSKDGTPMVIKEKFPQVSVIEGQENKGFGYGHNQILRRVKSKYHAVINPDIEVDTDVISQMAVYMDNVNKLRENQKKTGILLPKVLNPDGSEQHLPKMQPNFKYVILSKFGKFNYYRDEYTRAKEVFDMPVICENISGSFFLIDTGLFKQLHGFDRRYFMYFEDADLARRLKDEADIVYHPDYYVYHEWKRDNTKSMKGIRIFLSSMIKYILKWKRF